MSQLFDISDFGAVPDGKSLNTIAIQRAIDACHEAGGGTVVCGPGDYLTGSILMKSAVELRVGAGCRLVGSTHPEDYEDFVATGFVTKDAPEHTTKSLIRAVDATNIAITGAGEINGSGLAFYDTSKTAGRFFRKPANERPRMIMMYGCTDVRFEGVAFVDSPCWTFWLMKCRHINVHRIRVQGDQRMINNDGIDFDSCSDVTVSDSVFKTGDDCLVLRSMQNMFDEPDVCEKVVVTNCVLDSWCQGVRVGCPGDGEIRNCVFSNMVIDSMNNGILVDNPKRYLPPGNTGSANVHHLRFSNIVIRCAGTPVRVSVEEGIRLARLSDLSFSDLSITSGGPCKIEGCPETIVRNVHFNNVQIETTGEDAIVCRYCEKTTFNNVELSNRSSGGKAAEN